MVCHQADKAPEGIGDSSPGYCGQGIIQKTKGWLRHLGKGWLGPPFAVFCLIRLIAFGIDHLDYTVATLHRASTRPRSKEPSDSFHAQPLR
jgi:hypothetical protein